MVAKWLVVTAYTLILAAVLAAARLAYKRLAEPCLRGRKADNPNRVRGGASL